MMNAGKARAKSPGFATKSLKYMKDICSLTHLDAISLKELFRI